MHEKWVGIEGAHSSWGGGRDCGGGETWSPKKNTRILASAPPKRYDHEERKALKCEHSRSPQKRNTHKSVSARSTRCEEYTSRRALSVAPTGDRSLGSNKTVLAACLVQPHVWRLSLASGKSASVCSTSMVRECGRFDRGSRSPSSSISSQKGKLWCSPDAVLSVGSVVMELNVLVLFSPEGAPSCPQPFVDSSLPI